MLKLELNEQEKNALIGLINLAVKAGGLEVAEAGVILAKKIGDLKEEVKPVVKPEKKPVKKQFLQIFWHTSYKNLKLAHLLLGAFYN